MIVIVGLGAIGSVYATALKNAGCDVKIAVDASRLEKYYNNPLIFNDIEYKFDYFTPSAKDDKADLIIIATKGSGYAEVLDMIAPIVGNQTQIMPLLNGITSEKVAAQKYGWDRVVYGYFIGHTAKREGRRIVQDGSYRTVFGDKINDLVNLSPRVLKIKKLFDKAKIKYRIDTDMESSMWQKFVINIGLNQITASLKKNYGQIKQDPSAQKLMIGLMNEAQNVAVALKIAHAENFATIGVDTLNKMEGSDSSSMLQDVLAGRVTEVDMFAGEVCTLGLLFGVATPLNEAVLKQLSNN